MIRGIGCDVVEVSRVADVLSKHGERFVERLLTENERPLYRKRKALSVSAGLGFCCFPLGSKGSGSKALEPVLPRCTFSPWKSCITLRGRLLCSLRIPLKERLRQECLLFTFQLPMKKSVVAAFAVAEQRS